MSELVEPLALLLAAALGAGIAVLLLRAKNAQHLSKVRASYEAKAAETLRDQSDAQQTQQERHQMALRSAEERFNSQLKEQAQSALSVTMHPFVNTSREHGLFTRETLIEVGYKYQLLIQGLPCFEPHTVIVETTKEREINDETIELLRSKALEFAEIAAHAKSGGLPGIAVSIAKAVVRRVK